MNEGQEAVPAAPSPGTGVCIQCEEAFPETKLVMIRGAMLCGECKPVYLRKLQEGSSKSAFYEYGGFWVRLVARIIDQMIIGSIQIPFIILWMVLVFGGLWFMGAAGKENKALMVLGPVMMFIAYGLMFLFSFGLTCGYYTWFVAKKNATPGKMVLKLKIINADGSEKITYGKALGRFFADMLSGMTMNIGYVIAAFDDEKRALHDHICNTRVVQRK